jgi:CRISPR/Cas system-associated protein Csx1
MRYRFTGEKLEYLIRESFKIDLAEALKQREVVVVLVLNGN